jgi:hypothetical protein
MFARIVVDAIDMLVEIRLVANAVSPITALPYATFVFAQRVGRMTLFSSTIWGGVYLCFVL